MLHYATITSPVGWILLATGPRGLLTVHFCGHAKPPEDSLQALLQPLRPGVTAVHRPDTLREMTKALRSYFQHRVPLPEFPLDLTSGTVFQQKVWSALCTIPFGETRSYGDIARLIGHPRAARAVGQACGQNPVAILVPCHRVLGQNGGLGGYAGGVEIKKALLALEEQAFAANAPARILAR
jgi:methylated-DNA-[protein]-cysteine S-methyltransferase